MSRIDLHLHTTHSDGSQTPAEVVKLAHDAGVSALAITDHDITTGLPEAMAAGQELGMEIIPGIEISSRHGESELHVLGYFLKWEDPQLNGRLTTLRESRHRRNPKIVELLQAAGIEHASAVVVTFARSSPSTELACVELKPTACCVPSACACAVVSAVTCSDFSVLTCAELRLLTALVLRFANALVVISLRAVELSLAKSSPCNTPA